METEQRIIQAKYIEIKNRITSQNKRYPFVIKQFGYCSRKKFALSDNVNYNDILILLSLSSVVEFFHQKNVKYLYPYDLVISACHVPQQFNVVSTEKWSFFYIVFDGDQAKFFYNLIRPADNVMRINPLSCIVDIFVHLAQTKFDGSNLSFMQQSTLIHDLLFELYKVSSDILDCKHLIPIRDTDVNDAVNYITNHYNEPLTINDICNKVCLSKYYFCKIFKKYTGIPVYQYINEYRINKSKELLSYSKLTINSISVSVGYKNTLTFIRNFEKYTHMTPSEYRNNF